jgi:hypothetical protein
MSAEVLQCHSTVRRAPPDDTAFSGGRIESASTRD